ncbi:MAG: ABC transporter permease [Clostridiales bacterium]|nr:ABC transporter permease [Clostridiales bacterium]
MRNKLLWLGFSLILPVLIILLWVYVTHNSILPELLLPRPGKVMEMFWKQITVGTLKNDIRVSLIRILKGYALAAVVGISLGVIMGMSRIAERFFTLTFTSIRQIPMMAWVPLLIMWFGIGEESKVAVIFMAAYFPILINTLSGIRRTDPKLIEVGRMYNLSKMKLFTKIYLPSALPNIFVGLKLGLGISWMAVVGAEMIAASSGIGFRLNDARALMQFPIVFSGMLAIAITGVLMDWILTFISRVVTPWDKNKS